MIFKRKVDSGYMFMFVVFTLTCGALLYLCIRAFSVKTLLLCLVFLVYEILFVIPIYLHMEYEFQEDGLMIHAGWFCNRKIKYEKFLSYGPTSHEAKVSYALSEVRIALFFQDDQGIDDAITISPKDQRGFMRAFFEKTGLTATQYEAYGSQKLTIREPYGNDWRVR